MFQRDSEEQEDKIEINIKSKNNNNKNKSKACTERQSNKEALLTRQEQQRINQYEMVTTKRVVTHEYKIQMYIKHKRI